jgi:dynactin-6
MNESNEDTPTDLIRFVRREIQTRGDRSTYNAIKQQCLDMFNSEYFERHKSVVSHLLQSRELVQNPNPITNLSSTTFSPGCMICESVVVHGRVSFGPGTVVQPCSQFFATGAGSIIIGSDNIFEEQCIVINDSDKDMVIGSLNLFEVGCQIRAATIGNGNRVGVRATLGWGSSMSNHGLVVALQTVNDEAVLPDHCLVTPTLNHAADRGDNVALHQQQMLDYLSALRSPSSRTCLLNFHKLHKIKKQRRVEVLEEDEKTSA